MEAFCFPHDSLNGPYQSHREVDERMAWIQTLEVRENRPEILM